jgi:hypothetical protein
MLTRYLLKCGGCNNQILARLELSPSRQTRFVFPCPHCSYLIPGRYEGLELDEVAVSWEDATQLRRNVGEPRREMRVVTVGTITPLRPSARRLSDFGGALNATFGYLIGDNAKWANRYHERLHAQGDIWRQYERMLHYYMNGDWARFDPVGRALHTQVEESSKPTKAAYCCATSCATPTATSAAQQTWFQAPRAVRRGN